MLCGFFIFFTFFSLNSNKPGWQYAVRQSRHLRGCAPPLYNGACFMGPRPSPIQRGMLYGAAPLFMGQLLGRVADNLFMKRIIQYPLFCLLFLFVTACANTGVRSSLEVKKTKEEIFGNAKPVQVLVGKASWYGIPFHGRRTANGEIYNMFEMTAAHKTLPFGTRLLIVNPANQRSLVVRVNDRGPYVAGRILDLSYGAAKELGMVGTGVAKVWVEVYPVIEAQPISSTLLRTSASRSSSIL